MSVTLTITTTLYRNIFQSKVEAALYALPLFIIFAIALPQQKPQLQQLVGGKVSALRDDPRRGCFRINLGPGCALGEKAKKIGERESGERNAAAPFSSFRVRVVAA